MSRLDTLQEALASRLGDRAKKIERALGELTVTVGPSTVDMRRVAMISVGPHRLSLHTDGTSCEAHWTAVGTDFRLTSAMTLGPFMELLLSLLWD